MGQKKLHTKTRIPCHLTDREVKEFAHRLAIERDMPLEDYITEAVKHYNFKQAFGFWEFITDEKQENEK